MNRELEVLKQLQDFVLEFVENGLDRIFVNGSFDIIKTALGRLNYSERKLKVLEIIKEKRIDVDLFIDTSSCGGLEEYNEYCCNWAKLTQEEYNLLKEVLL